jgi:hypothetical protein
LGVGEAFVSKVVAFAWVAGALAFCAWVAPWQSLAVPVHGAAPAILVAGGLFTVAIAVLIRD